jgi:hypothetical protein
MDVTVVNMCEGSGDDDRVTFLDAVPVAGGGGGPWIDEVADTVQQLQVLSIDVERVQGGNTMPGKLAGCDLGGVYLRDDGLIRHIHIVRQLLDRKAPRLCFEPPHTVMEATANPPRLSLMSAQVKLAAKPFDMLGVVG